MTSASRTPPSETDLVGRVIDRRYRVDAVLGRGGMGVVYAATHLELERDVAIKVLAITERSLAQRFVREARVGARARHRNLMLVLDFGHLATGEPYLVVERLRGRDLAAELERRGPLTLREAARIVRQAAEGLDALHAAGVVHRDLKPSNVFLCDDGTVKLVDFGLAVLASGGPRLTAQGCVIGTPEFMAPELARGELGDARCDVYSLGAIVFEMLAGVPPFDGAPLDILLAKLDRRAPTLWEFGCLVSRELDEGIAAALSRSRDERPPTARAIAQLLEGAASGPADGVLATSSPAPAITAPESAPASGGPDTPFAAVVRPRRSTSHALVTMVLAAVVLVLSGALVALAGRRVEPEPSLAAAPPPEDRDATSSDAGSEPTPRSVEPPSRQNAGR